jgi:hypothetical protein
MAFFDKMLLSLRPHFHAWSRRMEMEIEILALMFSQKKEFLELIEERDDDRFWLTTRLGEALINARAANTRANKAFCAALFFAGVLLIEAQALALWLLR